MFQYFIKKKLVFLVDQTLVEASISKVEFLELSKINNNENEQNIQNTNAKEIEEKNQ